MPVLRKRFTNAWNAFLSREPTYGNNYGHSSTIRPDRPRLTKGNERTIITSIFNRIALDVAGLEVQHVRLDEQYRFESIIGSDLNECLTLSANIDQTSRAFLHDAALSLMDEGAIAIVPVDTELDPMLPGGFDIYTMRVGKIVEWYPQHVKVRLYDERDGQTKDIIMSKLEVAVVENPFYAVMNEHNSTLQRLTRKLTLLDAADEQTGSGKLDMIIQLPYSVRNDRQKSLAAERRAAIADQLANSKYGIAYIDSTEKVTQLNRSLENNLLSQIQFLTESLYSQLCISQSILDGTADEKTMLNYNNREVEPIISAIVDSMKRTFLTKTARTQRQSLMFFRDPFKLVPVEQIAEISDKLTRNEILSSNEVRQVIGRKPSSDPKADELRNKNLNQSAEDSQTPPIPVVDKEE